MTQRAIALAGGGPAAPLHIGALEYLSEQGISFDQKEDVWALSCIGAWVGVIYNQCDKGREVEQTKAFFRERVFRDDVSYSRFPINNVFGPDLVALSRAATDFLVDIGNYRNLVLPDKMTQAVVEFARLLGDQSRWNQGDLSKVALECLAANPFVRFATSFMYLSNLTGLSTMYYKDSSFIKSIDFEKLRGDDKPFIYYNAFNLDTKEIDLFSNRAAPGSNSAGAPGPAGGALQKYGEANAESLCACSALPYIEETVKFDDGPEYCEGALVDTVNFKDLLEDHPDLDEIWVSKIVDYKQIRAPKNIYDALGNLCMLFAATVGDDDVKLFKYHARLDRDPPWAGQLIEIEYGAGANFDWNYKNFDNAFKAGRAAAAEAYTKYKDGHFKREAEEQRERWNAACNKLQRFKWS
ncbi:MAG: patatin-like phospholipase family protein [Xanthobacteraceae bacterium]